MILNPALKTTVFSKRLVALRHRGGRVKRVMVAGLMLTSMVDMFSLLVIFLLQSFSNSPEVMALAKGITLPTAVSAAAPIDAPLLSISREVVMLDQKPVGDAAMVLANPDKLAQPLKELRVAWQKSHGSEEFKGDLHLQADRSLPSSMVARFVGMANGEGYASVHLAVVSGGKK